MNATNEPILKISHVTYEDFGLKGNPFPISGISTPRTPYPLIDDIMDKEVRLFIQETLAGREFCGLSVQGEFGAGKTYALRYIETLLRTIEMRPDAEEILAIYVERSGPSMPRLVQDVCNRIGRPRVRNVLLEMIFSDLSDLIQNPEGDQKKRLDDLKKKLRKQKSDNLFQDEDQLLSRICSPESVMNPSAVLEELRSAQTDISFLDDFAADSLGSIIKRSDKRFAEVAAHLAEFALSDGSKNVNLWGNFLSGKVQRGNNVVCQITAQDVWFYMLKILSHTGYLMVYWIIDEFEEIEYQTRNAATFRAFLADFRDLIDANPYGFSVVVAAKIQAWDMMRRLNQAFVHRFARAVILPPNTAKDIRKMIEHRLALVRNVDWDGDPLSPFTEGAVHALECTSKGNTRVAVEACHILLWHIASTKGNEIDSQTVGQISDINRAFFYARKESIQ